MSQLEQMMYGCKKRRKSSSSSSSSGDQRVFRFKTFGDQGYPTEFTGPFWKNVKQLLEFGQPDANLLGNGLSSWSFQLQVHRHRPDASVFLFVIEEPLNHLSSSMYRSCRHCRYIGWGHHMFCNFNYHFVVPSKETASIIAAYLSYRGTYYYDSRATTSTLPMLRGVMKTSNFVELDGHAMHGIFHCNGFGHLLCVNGKELGSDLTGNQIMDFWDRLCTNLRARKVSLNDISRKKGMELRLLHGAAYGKPWFSRWGYQFGRGTFSVTETMYQKAIQAIQNIPLCLLLHHLTPSDHYIPLIFTKYQTISDNSLITLGDLIRFMLELKSRLPREPNCNINSFNPGILLESTCRWSPKRVEMATRVIVDALKKASFKWVSRQEVRDAARAYIGDTGLLDFVLKSLANHVVGNYLIRRSLNPVTKVLEYCLEDITVNTNNTPVSTISSSHNHEHGGAAGLVMNGEVKEKSPYKITRFQVANDIIYLYRCILMITVDRSTRPVVVRATGSPGTASGLLTALPVATGIILDSKYLVKEFKPDHQLIPAAKAAMRLGVEDHQTEILCSLILKDRQNTLIPLPKLPSEYIQVKKSTTVYELKRIVEKYFSEMYYGLGSMVIGNNLISTNLNYSYQDMDLVSMIITAGSTTAELIFEGVIDVNELQAIWELNWTGFIDCVCGAKEDDGERMVTCDICEVWQHTRCARIPDAEEIPRIFLCSRCEQDINFSAPIV